MFSSLRSRLWLSYAFLIVTALSVVAVILFFSLLRSPLLYRQTLERLNAVQQVVIKDQSPLMDAAQKAALTFDVRIILYSRDKHLIWDTNAGKDSAIAFPVKRLILGKLPLARDEAGSAWLYSLQKLPDKTFLMVASPRPRRSGAGPQ